MRLHKQWRCWFNLFQTDKLKDWGKSRQQEFYARVRTDKLFVSEYTWLLWWLSNHCFTHLLKKNSLTSAKPIFDWGCVYEFICSWERAYNLAWSTPWTGAVRLIIWSWHYVRIDINVMARYDLYARSKGASSWKCLPISIKSRTFLGFHDPYSKVLTSCLRAYSYKQKYCCLSAWTNIYE